MAEPVKWFKHDFVGAPYIDEIANGTLIELFKVLLIDGFNVTTPTTLTYVAGTATATYGTAHGFVDKQIVAVSGCTEPEYNGEFRIVVIDSNTFTYEPGADPGGSATGAPSVKTAPVGGWVLTDHDPTGFRAAFTRTNVTATNYTLVVTNNGNEGIYGAGGEWVATVRIAKNYVDLDTYDEVSARYWPASHRYSAEEWFFVGDDLMFYWVNRYALYDRTSVLHWGDIESYRPGDTGHCVINGIDSSSVREWDNGEGAYTQFTIMNNTYLRYIATDYTLQLENQGFKLMGLGANQYLGDTGQLNYPNPATNELLVNPLPVYLFENASMRGHMPGIIQLLDADGQLHDTIYEGIPAFAGTPVMIWASWSSAAGSSGAEHMMAFKLSNWR